MFRFVTVFLSCASFAVFKSLLGSTIVMDDLDSATCYWRTVSDACCWRCHTFTDHCLFFSPLNVLLSHGWCRIRYCVQPPWSSRGTGLISGGCLGHRKQSSINECIGSAWSPLPKEISNPQWHLWLECILSCLWSRLFNVCILFSPLILFDRPAASDRPRQKRSVMIPHDPPDIYTESNERWKRNNWNRQCGMLLICVLMFLFPASNSQTGETWCWECRWAVWQHNKECRSAPHMDESNLSLIKKLCENVLNKIHVT